MQKSNIFENSQAMFELKIPWIKFISSKKHFDQFIVADSFAPVMFWILLLTVDTLLPVLSGIQKTFSWVFTGQNASVSRL